MDGTELPVHGRVLWKVLVLVGLVLIGAGLWAGEAWVQELNHHHEDVFRRIEASRRLFDEYADEYPLPPDRVSGAAILGSGVLRRARPGKG